MKCSLSRCMFPWLTVFTGFIGLALQSWLLSSADSSSLFPSAHLASLLSVLLLAITLELCLLALGKSDPDFVYETLFPRSPIAAVGTAIAGIVMTISAFFTPTVGALRLLIPIVGTLSGSALLVCAYCRFQGLRPSGLLHSAVTAFFIVRTIACCQGWGAEPQLQQYLLPLLASLFLLLAAYYRAEMDVLQKSNRPYVFFSQGALMCCLSSVAHPQGIFYLSAALWLASDYFVLPPAQGE